MDTRWDHYQKYQARKLKQSLQTGYGRARQALIAKGEKWRVKVSCAKIDSFEASSLAKSGAA
jgi:hypothetical protein